MYDCFKVLISMIFLSICLCSCSEKTDKLETQISNTCHIIEDKEESIIKENLASTENVQEIQNLDQKIKSVLENERAELFWRVNNCDFNQMEEEYSIVNLRKMNFAELENYLLSEIFNTWNSTSIQMQKEVKMISIENSEKNEITIMISEDEVASIIFDEKCSGKLKKEVQNLLVEHLEKVSGVSCIKTEYVLEDDENECTYLYYPNNILFDLYGRGDAGNELWISGCGIEVHEDRNITVYGIPIFADTQKDGVLSDYLSIDEIRMVCEMDWEGKGIPAVAVAEQASLIYMIDKEEEYIVPVWRIQGYMYTFDQSEKHVMNMMIDAKSGQVIRHS